MPSADDAAMSDYGTGYNGEECPFCWDTGVVLFTEMDHHGDSHQIPRPCPEGCLAPGEVPF